MRFSLAANGRFLVAAALWAAVAVSGQELSRTQISDTLFNADGSRAFGSLRISWKSFTASDGSTVAKNSVDLDIVDGIVTVALTPNLGAVPDGTYYSVAYRLHKGERSNEHWIVPDSEDPVSIADIRILSIPAAGMSVSLSQVNGLPAALSAKADKAATNTFVAPQVLREDAQGTSNALLGLQKNDGAAGVYFRLPELSGDVTYTLPPNAGSSNQALRTDGSGALFWSSDGAGSGSAYELLQQGGTSVTQRPAANFTSGFLVTDNGAQLRTDIAPIFGTAGGTITEGNDSRLSDARTPLAHASTHAAAGGDPLTPASIGALNRTNDFMMGTSPTTPVLTLQGSMDQTAALQEWRDGSGGLAALITAEGNGFFREVGVAALTGGTTAAQFFEIGGLKKFALSATDGVFDVLRYDNAGVFLDRPLRVFRDGKIETTVSMKVTDAGIGSGALGLTGDYVELQGVASPSNPMSGFGRVFLSSATGEVSVKKSSGSVVSLEGGGGASAFADLSDVDDTGRSDGDGLLWASGSGEWRPGVVVTPTNVVELAHKTIDGGAPRTGTTTLPTGANEMPLLRHQDNCTSLSGVADGVACFEEEANTIYVCESPEGIAGICDAAGEWTATGGSSVNIEEDNVEVISSANLTGIDFLGADFDVTDDANEANVAIAASIARDSEVTSAVNSAVSGTANYLAYFSGTNAVTGNANLTWDGALHVNQASGSFDAGTNTPPGGATGIINSWFRSGDTDQYVAMRAGTTTDFRSYLAWYPFNETVHRWLMGRNASNQFILYDAIDATHILRATPATTLDINSPGGTSYVQINNGEGGSGGFRVYNGGATSVFSVNGSGEAGINGGTTGNTGLTITDKLNFFRGLNPTGGNFNFIRNDADLAITSGNALGTISFKGIDSTEDTGACITGAADGTWSADVSPGRLILGTTPAASDVCAEAVRISADKTMTVQAGVTFGATGATFRGASSLEPFNCSTSVDGSIYFDTDDQKLCVCASDGTDTEWLSSADYSHATGHCSI